MRGAGPLVTHVTWFADFGALTQGELASGYRPSPGRTLVVAPHLHPEPRTLAQSLPSLLQLSIQTPTDTQTVSGLGLAQNQGFELGWVLGGS